jgi:putative transposase
MLAGMPYYRRVRRPGGTFFLTLVTQNRAPLFADDAARALLRGAIEWCRELHPFTVDAIVLLPDHLHVLMTLPAGEDDYPVRVANLKAGFTRAHLAAGGVEQGRSASRVRQRARGVWLKRFWEHTIRDAEDLRNHYDYVCYNAVKHGLVECPHEWPHSSFKRLVGERRYDADWCCRCERPGGGRRPAFEEPAAFEAIARAAGE